jgi:hypothetical protein
MLPIDAAGIRLSAVIIRPLLAAENIAPWPEARRGHQPADAKSELVALPKFFDRLHMASTSSSSVSGESLHTVDDGLRADSSASRAPGCDRELRC